MPNDDEHKPAKEGRSYPPLIPIVFFGAGLALHFAVPLGFPDAARPASPYAGGALVILAVALARWAAMTMKKAGVSPNPNKPKDALVTGGPFRHTRNPLYIAVMTLYAGVAFILRAGWMLALLPLMFLAFNRLVTRREEPYLEKRFGEEYIKYKSAVRRWV